MDPSFQKVDLDPQKLQQLAFAIQATIAFIRLAQKSLSLQEEAAKALLDQLIPLLTQVEQGSVTPQEGVNALNTHIATLNEALPPFPKERPYPDFTLNGPTGMQGQALDAILAFEQFLGEMVEAKNLPLSQESPLFAESLTLWEALSVKKVTPEQAMAKLTSLIKELNHTLPEEIHYPLPHLSAYQG